MKIAIISDVHANLFALQAVTKDIVEQKVDGIYSLGDVVGYGPNPAECFELISKYAKANIKGNHEEAMHSISQFNCLNPRAQAGVTYSKNNLTKEMLEMSSGLPYIVAIKD